MKLTNVKAMLFAAVGLMTCLPASADTEDSTPKKDLSFYMPQIHGALRPLYELDTHSGKSRFSLRNALLSIGGKIAKPVDYFFQVDACNQGKFLLLDYWVRVRAYKGLSAQLGQFRMPFGIDACRPPYGYYFTNRSFIGKQICNVRAVGFKASYDFEKIPLTLEAGIFNPTPITNHVTWNSSFSYAAKAVYTPRKMKFATGVQSIRPDGIRTNLIDACIGWSNSRLMVEGEYMYKHYTNDTHAPCHGYLFIADYNMPIKLAIFNKLSFQGRFDGMTAHSSALRDATGHLATDDPARNRITVGSTLSHMRKERFFSIRANYEKYFYHKSTDIGDGMGDKFVVELVVHF